MCGPNYGNASCVYETTQYCSEVSGYCGGGADHRDAQESDAYDWCDGAETDYSTAECSRDTPEGKCPPVDLKQGRCGPLHGCFACNLETSPYCNEATGYCG